MVLDPWLWKMVFYHLLFPCVADAYGICSCLPSHYPFDHHSSPLTRQLKQGLHVENPLEEVQLLRPWPGCHQKNAWRRGGNLRENRWKTLRSLAEGIVLGSIYWSIHKKMPFKNTCLMVNCSLLSMSAFLMHSPRQCEPACGTLLVRLGGGQKLAGSATEFQG